MRGVVRYRDYESGIRYYLTTGDCADVFRRAMGSSSKMFFQMKRFDAGHDEGGSGWLLQAEPALEMQPW